MTSISTRWTSLAAIIAVIAAALVPQTAHATLKHRYTFSGNANDSVGTAHGVVVDGGTQTHQYVNGMLALTGNAGEGSNAVFEDAYVNLPNGIVSAAAASATSGTISFEWWATVGTQRTWQRFGDFGTSNNGEDTSNSGNASSYLTVTPNSGGFNNGLAMHASLNGAENTVGLPGPFPIGAQKHVVAVYDKTNTGGGARPGGTQSLYLDGVNVATGAIQAGLDLNTLNDNNNWLGRSQWGDPIFDGLYNEFSIYDHALSQSEVTTNFSTGPVGGTILPSATVSRDTGAITLASPNGTLRLLGYAVRSSAGTLIPENWAEISGRLDPFGNGSFDSDDIWFPVDPTSPTVLEEAMAIDGVVDNGGPLGATPLSITDAGQRLWRKYYNEDLTVLMQVQLPGGAVVDLPAAVTFTGGAGVPWRRSDLNFDGSINPADYIIFRSNMLKPITTTAGNDPESYPFGDLDGDQDNDYGDFRLFKRDYDAANGEGALAALAGAVPEPSSAALAALAVAGGLVRRRRRGCSSLTRRISVLAVGIMILAAAAPPALAVVVHRYTFNSGNANDSVGTAHGTIVDPGTPQAVFTAAGRLDLSANTGGTPGDDAYLDLPNLIIQDAARSGTSGALSLEWWFTVSEARTWQRFGDFGGPLAAGGGENAANNGAVNFIYVTSNSGRRNGGVEISNNYAPPPDGAGNTEGVFGLSGPTAPALPVGVQHHVVGVWDKNDTDGGVNTGGTMRLFLNGAEILPSAPDVGGSRAIHELFDLNNLNDHDNWLGRSQWPDPAFDGAYNEFSIYDHPLSAAQVSANFAAGPVPVPLPTLIVNTVTGATAIKNLATGAINIDYYEIRSPGGRLNSTTWNSLSDQNIDASLPSDFNDSGGVDGSDLAVWKAAFGVNANGDADGDGDTDGNDLVIWQRQVGQAAGEGDSWDEAGGVSDNVLAELFLNSTSTLSVNEQLNLGNAFRTGGAQDLTFRFGIAGENGLTEGLVVYQTTGPAAAVPEPAGLVTICALGAATLRARRRRGSAGAQK